MQNKKWQIIRSTFQANLRMFEARFDKLINPRNNKEIEIVVLAGDDAVNVVGITRRNTILLIEQYRFGIHDYTTEIPGGLIDKNEEPIEAAKRELREETGYGGSNWQYLGKIPQNPVFQDAYIHHFIALDIEKKYKTQLDDAEDISILELSIKEVREGLKRGAFQHPHTVSAFMLCLDILEKIENTNR